MADLVLKDGKAIQQTYPDVESIVIKDTDGNPVKYNLLEKDSLNVTENGDYDAPEGIGYTEIHVDVPLQMKWQPIVS